MNDLKEILTPMLVVAAAMLRDDGHVLMQRRRYGAMHGGLWEFPGGKVETAETVDSALIREIDEELGVLIDPADLEPCGFAAGSSATADGTKRAIVILLYICRRWTGEPRCLDGEEIAWIAGPTLPALAMPSLDYPLAQALNRRLGNLMDDDAG